MKKDPRKNIYIISTLFDDRSYPNWYLDEFMEMIAAAKEEILKKDPKCDPSLISIQFNGTKTYDGDVDVDGELSINRLETDEEYNARLAAEKKAEEETEMLKQRKAAMDAKLKAEREYQEYLRLKQKYESKT